MLALTSSKLLLLQQLLCLLLPYIALDILRKIKRFCKMLLRYMYNNLKFGIYVRPSSSTHSTFDMLRSITGS